MSWLQVVKDDITQEQLDLFLGKSVSMDTETTGLDPTKDRLALVTLTIPTNAPVLVRIKPDPGEAPENLNYLLWSDATVKTFHHAAFDLAFLYATFPSMIARRVTCTKVASKIIRPGASSHSLKDLAFLYAGVDLPKGCATSDWFASELSYEQQCYAADDVLYLADIMDGMFRQSTAKQREQMLRAFNLLPGYARLKAEGYENIFSY